MAVKRHGRDSGIGEPIAPHPQLCNCGNRLQVANECWICYDKRTGAKQARDKLLNDNLAAIGLARREGESKHDHATRCKQYTLPRLKRILGGGRQANGVVEVQP